MTANEAHYAGCDRFEVYSYGSGICDCTATADIARLRSTRTAVPGPDQVVVDREALESLYGAYLGDLFVFEQTLTTIAAALSPDPSTETP